LGRVTNMLRFWLDEQGFGPYLAALRTRRDG
jgi:Na+-transporting NADH:ubiquinone oxidoreductase subunit NqrC